MKPSVLRSLFAGSLAAAPAVALANGGDTFLSATVIPNGPLNFMDTGTTIGFASDIDSLLPKVNGSYTAVAGADVFYRLDILVGGTVTFTLDPTGANWDPSIYITQSSLLDDNPGLGVGSGDDNGGSNITESFSFDLAPGTYFFAIDSFYSVTGTNVLREGTFGVTISGPGVVVGIIPEPSSVALLGVGLAAAGGALWRRRRAGAATR